MLKRGIIAIVLSCAMLVVISAQAQPPRGGGMMGGMGMMGGQGGMGFLILLRNQDVQSEIQLTADQKDKLQDLAQAARGSFTRGQNYQDMTDDECAAMRKQMQERQEKMQKDVEELLTPEQLQRLKEIRLQVADSQGGTLAALSIPDVTKDLAFTPDQSHKLKNLQQSIADKGRELMQGGMNMSQDERAAAFEKIQQAAKDASAKAADILTPEQKATLEKLKGKKFDIDLSTLRPQRPGG